jgi:hypothetical protein
MMHEVERLREKADRWYRLADMIPDEQMAKGLREYAADAETKAAVLETELCCRAVSDAPSPATVASY